MISLLLFIDSEMKLYILILCEGDTKAKVMQNCKNCKNLNLFGDLGLRIVSAHRLAKMKKLQHVCLYSHLVPV